MTRQFTQKHYRTVAKLLAEQRPEEMDVWLNEPDGHTPTLDLQELWSISFSDEIGYGRVDSWVRVVDSFIATFRADSIKFDEERFKKAIWKVAEASPLERPLLFVGHLNTTFQ